MHSVLGTIFAVVASTCSKTYSAGVGMVRVSTLQVLLWLAQKGVVRVCVRTCTLICASGSN